MDNVRALLVLLPDTPLPAAADVEHADALILVHPPEQSQYPAAAERTDAALQLGPPVYLIIPPIDSGLARPYLQHTLQPGVYGVGVQTIASVDQLRYLEGVLEELELRANIRPGLTAMAVGFHDPRALNLMSAALQTMRDSAERMTWIAFDQPALAESLGVPPESDTVTAARAQVILTAAAFDLPVVSGSPDDAESAAALGFRGCATDNPDDLERLRTIFTRPAAAVDDEQEDS